ncbi:cytochrome P450 6k1-like [Nymphalis io]|uniref:cytochrome P450 6k1-like n=1 Tax=Inachis io TaxID=171585 RepID=UPI0021689DF4|nr:cytochrome P450 6k1-like [Nymphalis io]XP_050349999.1 cytochrome P450 6k1-like [Nymphalis io]XP_050350001.1 cytochrome P450 6k1-like [Nymphalis io]XP_050350002.1 cytochrome P450 6k1-like [Nymphalis io]
MYLHLLFGVVGCLVVWLYMKWLKIKRYWADRGITHIRPVPILGNFTFLQRENIGIWLRRIYEQFKYPYIGIWIFWKPALVINSPDIARNILVKDFDNFRNRSISCGNTDRIGGLTLFVTDDPIWSLLRRQLSAVFSAAKLKSVQEYVRSKSMELVQRIHNDRNLKIDLKKMYVDYSTDIIGTSAFGVKSDAILTKGGPLRDVTNEWTKYSLYRSISWCSIFFLPELVDVFRFKLFPRSSITYFKKIYHQAVMQREKNWTERENRDLLDILIRIQKGNKFYSDDLIIAQAAIMLLGGFDTSGNLMTYITYELAHNPDVQEKLYQELTEATQRHGSAYFDMDILSELTYLNCVIKEGVRKYAPMSWLDRVAEKNYKIDDKLTIEAGTTVFINCAGMHFDPKYFPDPNKFDPDRFLPENRNKIEPFSYLPFGEGPRFCIGKRFGLLVVRMGMASILLNYKMAPYPNAPKPSDVKIDSRTVWYIAGEPLYVQFIPRP